MNIIIHEVFFLLDLYIVMDWFCSWIILKIDHDFTCYWTMKNRHRREIMWRLQLCKKPKLVLASGNPTEERNPDWSSSNIFSNNVITNTMRVPQSSARIFYCLVRMSSNCFQSKFLLFRGTQNKLLLCSYLLWKKDTFNPSTALPSFAKGLILYSH